MSSPGSLPLLKHTPLRLPEAGPAGQEWKLYVPVEAFSHVAEQAGALSAGARVLVAGKLTFTSWMAKAGSKKTRLAVLAPPPVEVKP
jgi:single-stranded DNA-binding protein